MKKLKSPARFTIGLNVFLLPLLVGGCASSGGGDSALSGARSSSKALSSVNAAASSVGTAAQSVQQASSLASNSGGLVSMLTNQLGVTPAQAAGGSGAIFQAAKARMAPSAFQTLTAKVPEVTQLLNQAPAASSGSALSRGISALGGGNSSAATLLQLGQTFKSLNMSPDMVNQFVPVVVNYVKSQGGQALSNMLQTALIGG